MVVQVKKGSTGAQDKGRPTVVVQVEGRPAMAEVEQRPTVVQAKILEACTTVGRSHGPETPPEPKLRDLQLSNRISEQATVVQVDDS